MDTSNNQNIHTEETETTVNENQITVAVVAQESQESQVSENEIVSSTGMLDSLKEVLLKKAAEELNMEKDMMELVRMTMEEVEKLALKGLAKKEMVMKLLRQVVESLDLQPEIKEPLESFLNSGLAENAVEMIIKASKNELKLNDLVEHITDTENLKQNIGCCFAFMKVIFGRMSRKQKTHNVTQSV